MYQFPEFRDMFFRRSISLYSHIWASNNYKQWYDELYDLSKETMTDDYAKWNSSRQAVIDLAFPGGFPYTFVDDLPFDIDEDALYDSIPLQSPEIMRTMLFFAAERLKTEVGQAQASGELLSPETPAQKNMVSMNEIHYNPSSSQNHEFIELFNNASTPVDISNWHIQELNLTLPGGSVIPSKSSAVIVKKDTSFRDVNPSALVLSEYESNLSNSGQTLTLTNADNVTVSKVSYGISGQWPTSPNGQGYSLSLISPDADESKASCWAPSQATGGSPYATNIVNASWDTSDCFTIDQANVSSNTGTTYQASQAEQTDESNLIDDIVNGSLKQPAITNNLIGSDDNSQLAIFIAGLGSSILLGFAANSAYAKLKPRKTDDNTNI